MTTAEELDNLDCILRGALAVIARLRAEYPAEPEAAEPEFAPVHVVARRFEVPADTIRTAIRRHPELGSKRGGTVYVDVAAFAEYRKRD